MGYGSFDIKKTIQVVRLVMKTAGWESVNYLKLIKILYLCDRYHIGKYERPITWDKIYGMKMGPVLSNVLDLIHSRETVSPNDQEKWDNKFDTISYDIFSIPAVRESTDELSESEIETITETVHKFKDMSMSDLVQFTHDPKNCPEYSNPESIGAKRTDIDYKKMILSFQYDEATSNEIVEELLI